MTLLETRDFWLSIGNKKVATELNIKITHGQCWGILGQNGIGKTTLLHALADLRDADQGELWLFGKRAREWRKKKLAQSLGVLVQEVSDTFPSTVLETALIGRHPHTPAWQLESKEDIALAKQALADVSLMGMENRFAHTLSGGERQRLAIASLLAQAPQLYLLDEPTNHLDLHFQVSLLELLKQKAESKNGALIMTLHDINLATRFCDHLLLILGDGKIVFGPAKKILTEDNLYQLYQHRIIKSDSAYLPA